MTPVRKVALLGYDLASIGIGLPEIREMDVRQLDYWAELKRANDAVNKKMADDLDRIRGQHGKH